MAGADQGGTAPDHYQLLGVPREASREEIAQAWRHRAQAEHPDRQPASASSAAADRFRALAEAYHVLSDPARRAAYDRALAREPSAPGSPPAAARVPGRRGGRGGPRGADPLARRAEPPLRAGPVRVEGWHRAPAADSWDEQDVRLAVLAELALRYLARDRDWPW